MPVPDPKQTALSADGLGDCAASVADELAAVRRCMAEQLTASDRAVDEMLAYVAARTGKMLRPAMMLLVARSCGNLNETHIRAAAVVELIHAATLLHDDVLDEAENRRSAGTANRLWGNASAVLLGDFLLSKVFVMSTALPPEADRLLAQTTVALCRGELRQNVERGNWRLTEEAYCEIVREKTASLFAVACRLGSLIAGGPEARHGRFAEYGLNVGIAFQITDDLLDIVGDEARVGKTLGTDLAAGKLTLPLIHFLAHADQQRYNALIARLSSADPVDLADLADTLRQAGSLEYTRATAERFSGKAIDALAACNTPNTTEPLAAIAAAIARRSA
jgi:octaprenyl-diphosphate synthase